MFPCARRYEVEYEEAKRKTKETLHPLKLELAEINDYVRAAFMHLSPIVSLRFFFSPGNFSFPPPMFVLAQIFEAIAKISSAKATNARNDEKIQQILKLSATA